jgi:tetratricopeptide (TPR) repeat protein
MQAQGPTGNQLQADQTGMPPCPVSWGRLAIAVVAVMFFGALGGFADGLTTDIAYKVTLGQKSYNLGSLGDAVAGATAALAIFTVAETLFGFSVCQVISNKTGYVSFSTAMRIIAIGVLSGYAGIRLLNPMTRKLAQQIATETTTEALKNVQTRSVETALNIKDGERVLAQYVVKKGQLFSAGAPGYAEASTILDDARKCFDTALQVDPWDAEALMGAANVMRERAEVKKKQGEDPHPYWEAALKSLDKILARDSKAAQALYFRACYKSLMTKRVEEVVPDLQAAIEIYPHFRERARADNSFVDVNQKPAFQRLVPAA